MNKTSLPHNIVIFLSMLGTSCAPLQAYSQSTIFTATKLFTMSSIFTGLSVKEHLKLKILKSKPCDCSHAKLPECNLVTAQILCSAQNKALIAALRTKALTAALITGSLGTLALTAV